MSKLGKLFHPVNSYVCGMRCLVALALFALASCGGGGGGPASVGTTPVDPNSAPGTTPSSSGVPPTFYLKLEETEPAISEGSPNTLAQLVLRNQGLCNAIRISNGLPAAPLPDMVGISRHGLRTVEYWSLNGKFKKLTATPLFELDDTSCVLTKYTKLEARIGDATSVSLIKYKDQTIVIQSSPAFRPNTVARTGQSKRTILGELSTCAIFGGLETCSWDRLANWRNLANEDIFLSLYLSAAGPELIVVTQAVQIELAPVIPASTFDIPVGFKTM